MDASQKHQKMHGRSRNTGIFQYFDTLGNPLKNRRFNVSQGRLISNGVLQCIMPRSAKSFCREPGETERAVSFAW
jgi:hypothetical protein